MATDDTINWGAVQDIYPDQYNRDPMEWRFRIYGVTKDHDDACYLDCLARNGRALIDAAAQRPEQAAAAERLREALEDIANFRMADNHAGYDDAYKMRDIAIDALAALAQPAGGEPTIPPLASSPATLEITAVGTGVPLPPDESDR